MKKIKLSILITLIAMASHAQIQLEHYGASSGTLGTSNSFFGYYSGNAANGSSANNSFFGSSSGRLTTSGARNVAIGSSSLYSNTTGNENDAIGHQALYSNTTGYGNHAIGMQALYSNTTGYGNTGIGSYVLRNNSSGIYNIAIGEGALYSNTASYNVAIGGGSLNVNSTGTDNMGIGYRTLYSNTTGYSNTASGSHALYSNTTAFFNTAYGYYSLRANTTGVGNTAHGAHTLRFNNTGGYNTAMGLEALTNNLGSYNTASGYLTQHQNTTGTNNTAYGYMALLYNITGSYNTAAGSAAGPTLTNLSNSTALGYSAIPTASNMIRIGNSAVTKIEGQVNFTTPSDLRFKKEIKEDITGLDFINQLRPVSYFMDNEAFDKFLGIPEDIRKQIDEFREKPVRQIGFIAQEVEKIVQKGHVFSGVRVPQNEKDHYSIAYAEFVVPLVKAVQELNAKLEEQQKRMELLLDQLNMKGDTSETVSPAKTRLFQNTPNPFSLETQIKLSLPETTRQAYVIVYNLEGKQLKSMVVPGRGNEITVNISGGELSAGMYLYALIADGKIVDTKRMILTK